MHRKIQALVAAVIATAAVAHAEVSPDSAQKLYDRVTPSLVPVQYVWQNELSRVELTGAGIIVREDGLVMVSMSNSEFMVWRFTGARNQ